MSGTTGTGWPESPDRFAVFVDKSMGRRTARGLSVLGLRPIWIGDVYPKAGMLVPDVEWIHDAAHHQHAVITKDKMIWVNREEVAAILSSGAKVFVVGNGNISSVSMALILGRHFLTLRRQLLRPGGCLWILHALKPIEKRHDAFS